MAVMLRSCRLSFLLILLAWALSGVRGVSRVKHDGETTQLTINLPSVTVASLQHNDYMCTGIQLPKEDSYIVRYEPRADPRLVHHMLLFGCPESPQKRAAWMCSDMSGVCDGATPTILYAWALNASGLQLPIGVGFNVGPSHHLSYAALQIHYGEPEALKDEDINPEALILHLTRARQQYIAGIYLLGSGSSIHAGHDSFNVDTACEFQGPKTIHPFAFRSHAHSLGEVVAGFVVRHPNGETEWEIIGSRSPQDAQAFYPANLVEVNPGDWLAARCIYNTTDLTHRMHMGPDSEDEMCNFYIMYYTANDGKSLTEDECWSPASKTLHFPDVPIPESSSGHHHHHHGNSDTMPGGQGEGGGGSPDPDSVDDTHKEDLVAGGDKMEEEETEDIYMCPKSVAPGPPSLCPPLHPTSIASPSLPLPQPSPPPTVATTRRPFFEGEDTHGDVLSEVGVAPSLGLSLAADWSLNGVSSPRLGQVQLGQVTAVAVDAQGHVHVLHRGPHVWDSRSFTNFKMFRHFDQGHISVPTLLRLDGSGKLQSSWGAGLFYMPHGLTIDGRDRFWITDVAMHQVLMFSEEGDTSPAIRLGSSTFKPGKDDSHFCQPSTVAVEDSGIFYVADGYCNQRILKFSPTTTLLAVWSQEVDGLPLFVPHSLALSPDQRHLFVADRENGRVLKYDTSLGKAMVFSESFEGFMGNVYAIAFNRTSSWPLYAVNGPADSVEESHGLSLQENGEVATIWGQEESFIAPHWIAADPTSSAVYIAEIGPNRIWKYTSSYGTDSDSIPTESPITSIIINDLLTGEAPKTTTSIPPASSSSPSTPSTSPTDNPSASPSTDSTSTDTASSSSAAASHDHLTTTDATGSSIGGHLTDRPLSTEPGQGYGDGNTELESDHPAESKVDSHVLSIILTFVVLGIVLALLVAVACILRGNVTICPWKYAANKNRDRRRQGIKLSSLLGPAHVGFSQLKTCDSDSEADEFPIFSRV